ncbi:hypothetical protein EA184_14905 [Escherichia coli]|nr:hypothetical protein EA184_14905 [Escherichia coli]
MNNKLDNTEKGIFIIDWVFRFLALIITSIHFNQWYHHLFYFFVFIMLALIDLFSFILLKKRMLNIGNAFIYHILITIFLGIFLLLGTFFIDIMHR